MFFLQKTYVFSETLTKIFVKPKNKKMYNETSLFQFS